MIDFRRNARSLTTPLAMLLLAATAVMLLWTALRKDRENRVADIVEAVSYASRSELARQLQVQFRALNSIRDFWTLYATTPVAQWPVDTMLEIGRFDGLDSIAWAERGGQRFMSTGNTIKLDHEPGDAEWARIRPWVDAAFEVDEDTYAAPFVDEAGHTILRLYLPVRNGSRDAVMVAVIDATEQMAALLVDDSPGYDISASCCGDVQLYRSGTFDADIPPAWTHGGLIQPRDGMLWRVEHSPSAELASDLRPWAVNTVLVVGFALALAIGAIGYHSRRADERARAARRAELQIRALNEELEQRVANRTRELNDALADLNTINLSVAHDVRSPLNAASLSLDALRATITGDERARTQLERIGTGFGQVSLILDRLLTLSRVSSFTTEIRRIDLSQLARQVAGELDPERRHSITVDAMPPACVDETMAHILLTNLISNALRHAGNDGRAVVEISCRDEDDGCTYVVLDHGPGIDPQVRDELFQPSRQVESGRGLGLGLAITARVIARHGGSIWAEDTPGGGASVCFRLPDCPESQNPR